MADDADEIAAVCVTTVTLSDQSDVTIRSCDYQILALNRTCSIWYQFFLVPDCMTHVPDSCTRFWYRFLVRMSWAKTLILCMS